MRPFGERLQRREAFAGLVVRRMSQGEQHKMLGCRRADDVPASRCDTHTVSEREGDCLTVIHSPSQSETQKRIENKSNPNLKKELAGLVGDAFAEAAKPPDKSDWQIPPEECSLFARRTP